MGCFSYICKKSGKAVLSSSFNGSPVHLFLLKGGKVLEYQYGNYNSYGQVFKNELRGDVKHELHDSFEWHIDWGYICDLHFNSNDGDGVAAILDEFWDGEYPTTISDDDPNQGWGEDMEGIGDCSSTGHERVAEPFHRVFTHTDTKEA